MPILAIETSGAECSVAIGVGDVVFVAKGKGPRSHTRSLLPCVDDVLSQAQMEVDELSAIAVSVGPGSFTGIRLAISVAKSLAYAAGIPVVPVSSLAVVAQAAFNTQSEMQNCVVVIDARMDECYFAEYTKTNTGLAFSEQGDTLLAMSSLETTPVTSGSIVGDMSDTLNTMKAFKQMLLVDISPDAESLLKLAKNAVENNNVSSALELQATYLRDKSSWKTTAQQKNMSR